jgi:hypothetical protein
LGGCFAHRVVNDFHPASGEQNNVEFLSLSRFPVLAFSAPKPVHFVQSPKGHEQQDYAQQVEAFLRMSDEMAAEAIGEVD